MPELTHECGKTVRFPSGTEGRRGKCPHCGGKLRVPGEEGVPAQKAIHLDPPAHWDDYVAYFEDRGPPPRPLVLPSKLMLKADADERWTKQEQVRPSRFHCPSCKERINVDQVICTKCGLDFRTGRLMSGKAKLTGKGMTYLEDIPWLADARRALAEEQRRDKASRTQDALAAKAPRKKKTRRFFKR